jgi:hypothetical protein
VIALLGLLDHVAPPHEHGVEHAGKTDDHGGRVAAVHPEHRAHRHDEGGHGADEGPGTWVDEMIVVVLSVGVSHFP